ncbi:MAG: EscU/YscU/HrcU family type III secretion system export apparatus switch protein [Mangrovicoccus sp.]
MSQNENDADKQYEASERKILKLRDQGQFPRSKDFLSTISLLVIVGLFSASGSGIFEGVSIDVSSFFRYDFYIAESGLETYLILGSLLSIFKFLAVFFLAPIAFIFIYLFGYRQFSFTGGNLTPKFSKISPFDNFKKKYGLEALVEFLKGFVLFFVFSAVFGVFVWKFAPIFVFGVGPTGKISVSKFWELLVYFFFLSSGVVLFVGVLDLFWQRANFLKKNMMTRQELVEEQKETEGDPYVKNARRQKGVQIVNSKMLAEVPEADVVIVNPDHYAVVLKWDRGKGSAPVVVAKGVDFVAEKIKSVAKENGVPIFRDPPNARKIYADVDLNSEIEPSHYKAVAAAIRYSDRIKKGI